VHKVSEKITYVFGKTSKKTDKNCLNKKRTEPNFRLSPYYVRTCADREARFFYEAAISVLQQLYVALCDGSLAKAVAGLVGGLVEFKEEPVIWKKSRNAYRIPIWSKWSNLLHGVEGIAVKNQARVELSLAKKHEWLKTASGRTMGMVFLSEPSEFENVVGFIVASWMSKMNHRSIAAVNYLRRRYNKDPITLEAASRQLTDRFAKFEQLSPYLQTLFRCYDADTGEMDEEPDSKKKGK
jgi:hypothetical protein